MYSNYIAMNKEEMIAAVIATLPECSLSQIENNDPNQIALQFASQEVCELGLSDDGATVEEILGLAAVLDRICDNNVQISEGWGGIEASNGLDLISDTIRFEQWEGLVSFNPEFLIAARDAGCEVFMGTHSACGMEY